MATIATETAAEAAASEAAAPAAASEPEAEAEDTADGVQDPAVILQMVIDAHKEQFVSMKLPEALWSRAAQKLAGQVLDAGTAFGFTLDESEGVAPHLRYDVVAKEDLTAASDCWLSAHIWAFPDEEYGLNALSQDTPTAQRMAQLMGREDLFEQQEGDSKSSDAAAEAVTTNATIGNQLIDELQRYAYPLFDAAGTRYYYVMDEIGSRVRMISLANMVGDEQEAASAAAAAINTCFGAIQSLVDGYTYTVIWLCKDVPALTPLRRARHHRLSLLGRGKEAWETRFEYETSYDWYGGWDDGGGKIRQIVLEHVRKDADILVVGTGTSKVPIKMVKEGYTSVHATDYVEAVIEKMRGQYGDVQGPGSAELADGGDGDGSRTSCLTWGVMDARSMSAADASYDCIFDKGCMDAMLIPPGATGRTDDGATWVHKIEEAADVLEYMQEVARVLRPGQRPSVSSDEASGGEQKAGVDGGEPAKVGGRFLVFSFHPLAKFVLDLCESAGLECLQCYEITDDKPSTTVKTSATFKHMFRVYIFAAP